jgi:hypothetical protein
MTYTTTADLRRRAALSGLRRLTLLAGVAGLLLLMPSCTASSPVASGESMELRQRDSGSASLTDEPSWDITVATPPPPATTQSDTTTKRGGGVGNGGN